MGKRAKQRAGGGSGVKVAVASTAPTTGAPLSNATRLDDASEGDTWKPVKAVRIDGEWRRLPCDVLRGDTLEPGVYRMRATGYKLPSDAREGGRGPIPISVTSGKLETVALARDNDRQYTQGAHAWTGGFAKWMKGRHGVSAEYDAAHSAACDWWRFPTTAHAIYDTLANACGLTAERGVRLYYALIARVEAGEVTPREAERLLGRAMYQADLAPERLIRTLAYAERLATQRNKQARKAQAADRRAARQGDSDAPSEPLRPSPKGKIVTTTTASGGVSARYLPPEPPVGEMEAMEA